MRTGDHPFLSADAGNKSEERQHTVDPSNAPNLRSKDGSSVYIMALKSSSTPLWQLGFRRRVRQLGGEGMASRMRTATATASDMVPRAPSVADALSTNDVSCRRRRVDRSDRGEQKALRRMSGEPTHSAASSVVAGAGD